MAEPDVAHRMALNLPALSLQELRLLMRMSAQARSIVGIGEAPLLPLARGPGAAVDESALCEANGQLMFCALRLHEALDASHIALAQASHAAQFDALTGLPNRALLFDRIDAALARSRRDQSRFALLFMDLDGFKAINDSRGHAFGDAVLQVVAKALGELVREVDTVSRYGGDEFVILLTQARSAAEAEPVALKIQTALARPRRIGGVPITLGASVGIAFFDGGEETALALIDRADAAMYAAKQQHHGTRVAPAPAAAPVVAASDGAAERPAVEPPSPVLRLLSERLAEMREVNAELVRAALRAQELHALAQSAWQREKDFAVMLAHELRGPLAPISSAAALLGFEGASLSLAKAIIERQVALLARLIGDLLDTGRLQTGRLRIERTRLDLVDVLRSTVQTCRGSTEGRAQTLVVDLPPQPLWISGDAMRLGQVFMNLLENASKYAGSGGAIVLSLVAEEGDARVAVLDDGIGISAAGLPHIFDAFVREPHAAGVDATGLGIGLRVARELVQAHEGTIAAYSEGRGRGSRFEVRLPGVSGPLPAASERKAPTAH